MVRTGASSAQRCSVWLKSARGRRPPHRPVRSASASCVAVRDGHAVAADDGGGSDVAGMQAPQSRPSSASRAHASAAAGGGRSGGGGAAGGAAPRAASVSEVCPSLVHAPALDDQPSVVPQPQASKPPPPDGSPPAPLQLEP
jgi:hypothetical protein